MDVVKKINIDLSTMGNTSVVYAVQNDYGSRKIEASLFSDGVPWIVPNDSSVSISYKKADGTTGWYDKLEDGASAASFSGNAVTVFLAAQSLTVAGDVSVSIVFNDPSTLKQLASFPFVVNVSAFPSDSGQVSNNFYNYGTVGEINEAIESLEKNVSKIKEAFYIHITKREGVYYSDKTYDEIYNAVNWYYTKKERPVYCILWDNSPSDFIILPFTAFDTYEGDVIFTKIQYNFEVVVTVKKDSVEVGKAYIPYKSDIPEKLPNPYALIVDGVSYDGSEPVEVESNYTVSMDRMNDGTWVMVGTDEGIAKANAAGKPVYCWCLGRKLPLVDANGVYGTSDWSFVFAAVADGTLYQVTRGSNGVSVTSKELANKEDISEALPNPKELIINGNVYDGNDTIEVDTRTIYVGVKQTEDGWEADWELDMPNAAEHLSQLDNAYVDGRVLICRYMGDLALQNVYGSQYDPYNPHGYIFSGVVDGIHHRVRLGDDGVSVTSKELANKEDIPETLPNPYALTVNEQTYDGSAIVELDTRSLVVEVNGMSDGSFVSNKTVDELKLAYEQGRDLYCRYNFGVRLLLVDRYGAEASGVWGYTFMGVDDGVEHKVLIGTDGVRVMNTKLVPDALPNPHPLTINGQRYDGSYPVDVSISGGTGEGDGGGSYIPVPAVAGVGQTIVVKAVDENGKPTEWEPKTDYPAYADPEGWEHIKTVTVTSSDNVWRLIINVDADGNKFAYDELILFTEDLAATSNSVGKIFINRLSPYQNYYTNFSNFFVTNAQSGVTAHISILKRNLYNDEGQWSSTGHMYTFQSRSNTGFVNQFRSSFDGNNGMSAWNSEEFAKKICSFGIQTSGETVYMRGTFKLFGRNYK